MIRVLLITLNFWTISAFAQVDNPVPEPIEPSGIVFQLEEYIVIPASSTSSPLAKINMLREAPDGSGRKFVNDLNGKMWVIDDGEVTLYLDHNTEFTDFINKPGFGTGFGAFDFHPEFDTNGIFYTCHTESSGSSPADFIPFEDNGISMQWVVIEWKLDNPSSTAFVGTKREIFRADFPYRVHGMQDIQFNPNATLGEDDYGLLYICLGDGGSSLNFLPNNIQTPASYLGTIFRIDPLGNNSANEAYGIPTSNPFANDGDSTTLGEVWAYGFRNPHRISWDTGGDHKMLIGDIGENNIEEVNLGIAGVNYGWSIREGTFLYDRNLGQNFVFELPPDDSLYNYIYPVAQYDHDEGAAIVGGYVYRGSKFPQLDGKYVFGDIALGRVFMVNADELHLGSQSTIEELLFVDENGDDITLLDLVNHNRVDLRFGIDSEKELYILTKTDGKIRRLKEFNPTSVNESVSNKNIDWFYPNPGNGTYYLHNVELSDFIIENVEILDMYGRKILEIQSINSMSKIDLSKMPSGKYWAKWQFDGSPYTQLLIKI